MRNFDWLSFTPPPLVVFFGPSPISKEHNTSILDVRLLLHVRVRTSLKPRVLCSREIDLTDLCSLLSYSKYLMTRDNQYATQNETLKYGLLLTILVFKNKNSKHNQNHSQLGLYLLLRIGGPK
jgi:hypothetical protein